jgi:glyoxylase-like metal-dependent hydrolase (beta-lactamase superfamily II)
MTSAAPVRLAVLAAIALGATASLQDAGAVVADVARALGSPELKTIQYSATGFTYSFAQNYRPDVPYPKFRATYSRAIDFERGLAREETVRTQFETPPRGGGGQPLYTEARAAATVTNATGWGGGALALTPHGFVKAAAASSPTVSSRRVDGRTMTVISFTARNQFKVEGYINQQRLIDRIDTWVANPILGDTLIQTTFSGYRDFGGVQFPTRIVQRQGGFPTLELTVNDVRPNAAVTIQAPAAVTPQPARAEGQQIVPGVWYLTGTPDPNSQLVELRDYAVLIESSVSEARALANLAEARRLVPNKPIRYHVNSHHHGDHAAGVRAFVSEGLTIISHEMNRRFYEQALLKNPHTIAPDALARNPRPASFIWVDDKFVLSDGTRSLEIYHVPNGHAANLLMSYLPQERLLMITDIFNDFGEPRPNDPPPGIVTPYYAALGERVRSLKLAIDRVAPSHGRSVLEGARLWKALDGKVQAPAVTSQ